MRPFSLLVQAQARTRPSGACARAFFQPPCSKYGHPRHIHNGPRDTVKSHPHPDEFSFERLGLRSSVLTALRLAFPSIKHPTPIQHRFIDAVLKGQDVLLKDKTGTGKYVTRQRVRCSRRAHMPFC